MAHLRVLDVFLHGRLAGYLTREGTTTAFEFTDNYLEDPDRRVLGWTFEEGVHRTRYASRRLPNWFGHLLPEGQLRRLIEQSIGLSPAPNRLDQEIELLEVVGADLPGAVQLRRSDPGDSADEIARLRTPPEELPPTQADLGEVGSTLRFAVAGVGLKMSLLRDNHRFTAPAIGGRGDWLVKLPDRTFPDLPRNEYAIMKLASLVGIEVPAIRLVHRDEVPDTPDALWSAEDFAFAIERFDRRGESMIHIEDFAQVRDVPPGDRPKYSGNYETVASIAYRRFDTVSLEQFVRRLAFSLAIGNSDAHLKNWSLIYPDGRNPHLSPAYDIVSVMAYASSGIDTELALRFGNRKQYGRINVDSFERLTRKLNAPCELADIARDTVHKTKQNFDVVDDLLAASPRILEGIHQHFGQMSTRLTERRST